MNRRERGSEGIYDAAHLRGMPSMTPPTWAELHAAGVPGPLNEDEMIGLAVLHGGSPLGRSPGSIWERVYTGLCQIEAVRYLAKEHGLVVVWTGNTWDVSDLTDDTLGPTIGESRDFDVALRFACSAILNGAPQLEPRRAAPKARERG